MPFDLEIAAAGLFVGFTVGLTGMGGGALMTPILVLLFNVQPRITWILGAALLLAAASIAAKGLLLVLLAVPAWGALDAAVHPAPAWASAPVGRRLAIGAQLVGAPVGLGFLAASAYFGLVRRHLAVPRVPEVVPVLAELSGPRSVG